MTANLSAFEKLNRAKEHLAGLRSELLSKFSDRTIGLVNSTDSESGVTTTSLNFPPEAQVRYGVWVGDIVQNLRSSYEHMLWQLVLANGHTPGTHNQFPTVIDPDKYGDARNSQLNGVSESVKGAIGDLQPFHAGDQHDKHPLWLLNELARIDRHQVLHLPAVYITNASVTTGSFTLTASPGGSASYRGPSLVNLGRFRHGEVVQTIPSNVVQPDISREFEFSIAFDDQPPAPNVEIVPLLWELIEFTESAISSLSEFLDEGATDRGEST